MDLRIGDHVTISIETVAFGGEGLGRLRNMALFVPFTAEGDVVEAQVTEVKKSFARGRLVRIIEPSTFRVEPRCLYFGHCGGCAYQHIKYDRQLQFKKQQLKDAFERIGKLPASPVTDIIPSPVIYGYRGKADFHVETASDGRRLIGFKDMNGQLVEIERCEIVDNSINKNLDFLRKKVARGAIPVSGNRFSVWSGTSPDASIPSGKRPVIERTIGKHSFTVPADGFFQANTVLVEKLVDEVNRLSNLKGTERVVDAYCGVGLFSLFLAHAAGSIYGIDTNGDTIRCARFNAKKAGINNVNFVKGDAGEKLRSRFAAAGKTVDVIILDPPRSGCNERTLSAVSQIRPRKLIYVSCNPATQARDCRYLTDRGLILNNLIPIDMFPQTAHIETMAILQ